MKKTAQYYSKDALQLPSSASAVASSLADAGVDGENFLELIRARERYRWLAQKVDPWLGLYSVGELVDLLDSQPQLPGQHQKALVALSMSDDLSALSALEDFDSSGRGRRFELLHVVALGQWRQRYRANR